MPVPWESYGLCNTSSGFPSATRQVAMRKVAALTLIATTVGYTTVDKYPATLPEDSNVDVVVVVVVVVVFVVVVVVVVPSDPSSARIFSDVLPNVNEVFMSISLTVRAVSCMWGRGGVGWV